MVYSGLGVNFKVVDIVALFRCYKYNENKYMRVSLILPPPSLLFSHEEVAVLVCASISGKNKK